MFYRIVHYLVALNNCHSPYVIIVRFDGSFACLNWTGIFSHTYKHIHTVSSIYMYVCNMVNRTAEAMIIADEIQFDVAVIGIIRRSGNRIHLLYSFSTISALHSSRNGSRKSIGKNISTIMCKSSIPVLSFVIIPALLSSFSFTCQCLARATGRQMRVSRSSSRIININEIAKSIARYAKNQPHRRRARQPCLR